MTILFMDGCASYNDDPAFKDKWDYLSATGISISAVSDIRTGAYHNYFDGSDSCYKDLGASKQTVVLGVSLKRSASFSIPAQFRSSDSYQVSFTIQTDGTVNARLGSHTGTILASSAVGAATADDWQYLEFKAVIDDSVGSVECRRNGVAILSATGLDTRFTAGVDVDRVYMTGLFSWTDLYIDDANFHAPVGRGLRIDTIYPTEAGNYSQMTPTAGSNYQCVDEPRSDNTDTDYVSSGTVGEKDTYGFADIVDLVNSDILAVAVNCVVRQDEAGTVKYKPVIRIGTTDYLGNEVEITTDYLDRQSIWELNPDDSLAWEYTDINNAEFGIERTV